jgi:dTDP-glucose pyrophosphorylase
LKKKEHTVIVLCGGDINASNLPIATSGSNAMIPVNGKPVIGWILDDLVQKQVVRVIIVTQAKNEQLIRFVHWAFQGRVAIEFALLEMKSNIIHSLQAGMEHLNDEEEPITVILGDTLISEPFPAVENYVFVSSAFDDPRNWCLAETDAQGVVNQYFDKKNIPHEGLVALAGQYHFGDVGHLAQSCEEALRQGGQELSDVLHLYAQCYSIRAIEAAQWYDFGHMPHFLKAKRELLQSRYFNQISIEPALGILRKTSTRHAKLRDEHDWYLALPEALKVLTPRVLGKEDDGSAFTLAQEYYGYPNLAELYLYGNFDLEIWKAAIQNLMQTHLRLKSFGGFVGPADARQMYWGKTEGRVAELIAEDSFFRELMALERIAWNGKWLDNLPLLKDGMRTHCEHLAATVEGAVTHGDFCLSNILYDINNQLVRLIDPRGSFGKKGVYGDPRYDVAKLRHSLHGGYDFIVADLFTITSEGRGHFHTAICGGEIYDDIAQFFDVEIVRAGYQLDDIIFIEALLFLSMIPLHKGKQQRQIMMYLQAIKLFNTLAINN